MTSDWLWTPNISLGPILIGSDLKKHIITLDAVYDESTNDSTDWDSYVMHDYDVYMDVSNGKVVSITSYSKFLYEGTNIVGATMTQLAYILGCAADEVGDPVEYDDGDVKISYDYFDLGLQVWTSDDVITSATCLTYSD